MSSIEEVKSRTDIVDVVSETVELRRAGKNYSGFCPFHSNTRTPSFVVFPDSGTWRCFGQCNEGGDVFKFVMKREGWDFGETLKHLAERAGVELRKLTPQEEARHDELDRLRGLLEDATQFYRHQLTHTEAGQPALAYLRGRGLTDETIAQFELGYAPESWEAVKSHFNEKGYTDEELIEAGLVYHNEEKDRKYDRFRHRVMVPIRDGRGRMAGYGARALDPGEQAKYINSPQSALFDKSGILYGLDKARKSIRSEDQVVIVEGYLDVIAPYQAGYTNLVSPMGTALTEAQLRLIKRYTRRIVLALDADAAGTKATLRGLEVARQTLDRESDIGFNARGLLKSEGRLQADIRVTTLPDGMDPDEVVNEDPEKWAELVAAARPIVTHVMETLAVDQDLEDPKVKQTIASQVMPLINDIPSAIERDTYTQNLARFLKLDERTLLSEFRPAPKIRRPVRRPQPRPEQAAEAPPIPEKAPSVSSAGLLEAYCLGIIMRRPELLYQVDRALKEAGLPGIHRTDFQLTNHQEMFIIARKAIEQDYLEPLNYASENIPFPLIELADEIVIQTEELDPSEERVLEDLVRVILELRRRRLREHNEQLRFLQEEAQEGGDLKATAYTEVILKNSKTLHLLDKAIGAITNRSLA